MGGKGPPFYITCELQCFHRLTLKNKGNFSLIVYVHTKYISFVCINISIYMSFLFVFRFFSLFFWQLEVPVFIVFCSTFKSLVPLLQVFPLFGWKQELLIGSRLIVLKLISLVKLKRKICKHLSLCFCNIKPYHVEIKQYTPIRCCVFLVWFMLLKICMCLLFLYTVGSIIIMTVS